MIKCILSEEELGLEYMQFQSSGQIMNHPIYGQILYNSCLSNAFKLNLGHNVKIFLAEMKRATGKEIVEHVIGPAKLIPASHVWLDVPNC